MNIGMIGLGAMGSPMAANILKTGDHSLRVFDLDSEKVSALCDLGASAASSAPEAATEADVVLMSLPNDSILKSVVASEEGVLSRCAAGTVLVDLSSVSPGTAKELAALAAAKGAGYMDAPVSGGVAGAEAGTLTIMAGASDADFAKALPVLEVIGRKISHIGPVGSGDAVKIVNNLLLGCHMAALSEALALGESCGLDRETIFNVVKESSGNSYVLNAKMEKFIIPENFDGGFAVDLQLKDLNLALSTAEASGMELKLAGQARDAFADASREGWGRSDISSLVKTVASKTDSPE